MRLKKFLLAAFMVLAAPCICAAKDSASVFRVSVMQSDEHLFHESIIENLEGTLEKALGTKTKVENLFSATAFFIERFFLTASETLQRFIVIGTQTQTAQTELL